MKPHRNGLYLVTKIEGMSYELDRPLPEDVLSVSYNDRGIAYLHLPEEIVDKSDDITREIDDHLAMKGVKKLILDLREVKKADSILPALIVSGLKRAAGANPRKHLSIGGPLHAGIEGLLEASPVLNYVSVENLEV